MSGDSVPCKMERLVTLMLTTQPDHALSRPTRGTWCGLVFGEGDVGQVVVGVRCCGLGEEKGRCTELLVLEATHGRDASTSRGGHSEAPTSYVVIGLVPKWDESLFGTRTPRLTLTICLPMSLPAPDPPSRNPPPAPPPRVAPPHFLLHLCLISFAAPPPSYLRGLLS